jgi:predicted PurR-regulated permease PerM
MKRLLRKPIVIILSVLILSIIFSILLYSTFCRLEQNIDWNALNAIASLVMAIFTIVAVSVAIYIPKKDRIIASKVDLYEYRYQLFYSIEQSFISIYNHGDDAKIESGKNEHLYRMHFLISETDGKKVIDLFKSVIEKGEEKEDGVFSFEEIEPELKELSNIFNKYIDLRDYGIIE